MAETLRDKTIRESEQACQHAVVSTPAKYREFITLIGQNKNIGTRQKPEYAPVKIPYMNVDGRVMMARDEHFGLGVHLDFVTEYITIVNELLCKVTLTSPVYGISIGHAKVGIAKEGTPVSGVDSTHPFENAETSAIGRALGFMGYGLFGSGIASADDVLAAMSEQDRKAIEEASEKTEYGSLPPTQKHLGVLFGHLKRLGVRDGDKHRLVEFISKDKPFTSAECTEQIRSMDHVDILPWNWFGSYVMMLLESHPTHDKAALKKYWRDNFGNTKSGELTQEQRQQLLDWALGVEEQDDDVYTPGEDTEGQSNPWLVTMTNIQNETGESIEHIESWLLKTWGQGTYHAVEDMPVAWIESVNKMSVNDIKTSMSGSLV